MLSWLLLRGRRGRCLRRFFRRGLAFLFRGRFAFRFRRAYHPGQERLDVFCGFLREIGRCLGKPVLMDPEGDYDRPVLGFDVEADRVVLLAEPLVM